MPETKVISIKVVSIDLYTTIVFHESYMLIYFQ